MMLGLTHRALACEATGFAGGVTARVSGQLVFLQQEKSYSSATFDDEKSGDNHPSRLRKMMQDKTESVKTTLSRGSSAANDVFNSGQRSSATGSMSYRPPTPPTGIPLSQILSNTFPLSYTESYDQWRLRKRVDIAESDVLSHLPFYPESDGVRRSRTVDTVINSKGHYVHEFVITRQTEPVDKHLVVLHGYGAGLAYFYKNLGTMSDQPGWQVHALDLLGYGRSSRPKFKVKAQSAADGVLKAESFFVDAIEQWRVSRGIDRFSLIAHSLGAYIGSSYASRFPGRVDKFMLVSPAGVPRSMYSIPEAELPEDHKPPHSLMPLTSSNGGAPRWFKFLWECHWSPFSLVRYTGPLGAKFVSGWSSRRFANLPRSEADALHRYSYGIFNSPGSGEYALNYLLAPGANGRWPLAERAHRINCPSVWVYGDRDWMDIRGGYQAAASIRQAGGYAEVVTVPNSGHHIYLDNPSMLNWHITNFMNRSY